MLQYFDIIENLSIDEKLSILTDGNFLASLSLEKSGMPYMAMARLSSFNEVDGGLRYPSFEAMANAWDKTGAYTVAEGLAMRAREEGINVALLPKANVRSNVFLDGATEDPYLMGSLLKEYATAVITSFSTPKRYLPTKTLKRPPAEKGTRKARKNPLGNIMCSAIFFRNFILSP